MVETWWETPVRYAAFGGVFGAVGVLARTPAGSVVKRASVLTGVAGVATVSLADIALEEPFDTVIVLFLLVSGGVGGLFGSSFAELSLWYVRWVRRVFREAAERIGATP